MHVDIETAIKLLNVGFPQPQQGYNGETTMHPLGMIISKPTVKEVIDFVKKRDNIHIESIKMDNVYCWRYYSIDNKGNKSFVVGCKKINGTSTEEEALNKGIKYALKQ